MSYSQLHYVPFIADKFDFLFINVFANNAAFLGSLSQILVLQDIYCARIREIDLQLNPQESIIYFPNEDPTDSAPLELNTPGGMQIPCIFDGLKSWVLQLEKNNMGIGQSICKNIISQVENDLTVLRQILHLHQREKLLTFCTNTRLMYFLRNIPAEIFTENVQQSDHSMDNFLTDTYFSLRTTKL